MGKTSSHFPHAKTQAFSIGLYPKDDEILNWICDYLGCTRSDAVRRALTSLATHLAYIDGSKAKA